jgi:Co/Zn/Cd efflux system component
MSGCECTGPNDHAHTTPEYRRALWMVVMLNVGYGIVEMMGGFLSGSQAVKADALDFIGDGSITLLGLVAIGWSLAWRARAAVLQGLFLGALGIGVLATTIYRVFVVNEPESLLMGIFGAMALVVNFTAAYVLRKHREVTPTYGRFGCSAAMTPSATPPSWLLPVSFGCSARTGRT